MARTQGQGVADGRGAGGGLLMVRRGNRRRRAIPRLASVLALVALAGCAPPRSPFQRLPGDDRVADASLDEARIMDRIDSLLEDRAFVRAREELDRALADGLDHPRAHLLHGRLLAQEGDHEAAIRAFDRAIAASPGWPDPYLELARSYLVLDRRAAAASVFDDLDRLFPDHPAGPYGRGVIALQQGRNDDARAQISRALERDPDFAPAMRVRAHFADLDGDDQLRRELLFAYLAEQPSDAAALFDLGALDESLGRLDDARRSFRRSWELTRDADTAARLAELARRRGDDPAAARWRRLAGIDAGDGEAANGSP